MSQHAFASVYNGRPVLVQMGWDAPLQHYFTLVADVSGLAAVGDVDTIYSNLADPAIDGGTDHPGYYWRRLDDLGIA